VKTVWHLVMTTDITSKYISSKAGRHAAIRYNYYRYLSLTANKVVLFYVEISAFEKKVLFIFELHTRARAFVCMRFMQLHLTFVSVSIIIEA
jgi:hypothetical protein